MMQMIQGLWPHMATLHNPCPISQNSEETDLCLWYILFQSIPVDYHTVFVWQIQYCEKKEMYSHNYLADNFAAGCCLAICLACQQYFKNLEKQFCWPHCILT